MIQAFGLPNRPQCTATAVTAVAVIAITIGVLPFGAESVQPDAGVQSASNALAVLTGLLSALLLAAQAHIFAERATLGLGVAYLFACLIVFPQAASTSQGMPWLWALSRAASAAGAAWFAFARPAPLRRPDLARAVVCAAAALAAGAVLLTYGPALGAALPTSSTLAHAAGLAVSLAGAALVIPRLRPQDALAPWLAVSLLASVCTAALSLHGAGTLGWYTARGLGLLTGVTTLVALAANLLTRAKRVQSANVQLEAMVRTDPLTGLDNRRAFDAALQAEWRRARREETAMSLLMVDVDLFKSFNDRYGHPAGDACLRRVGAAIDAQVKRPADLAARIGGEEFVVLLPGTDEAGAARVAERVRAAIWALAVPHGDGQGRVTVSVGAATRRPSGVQADPAELLAAADRALYDAKGDGRNRVCAEAARVCSLA